MSKIRIPALNKIDRNRDGGATIEEFGQALRKANKGISDSQIGYIFHAANSNRYAELVPCLNDDCALSKIELAALSDMIAEHKKSGFDKGFRIDIDRIKECVSANIADLQDCYVIQGQMRRDSLGKIMTEFGYRKIADYWKGLEPYVSVYNLHWTPMWTRNPRNV
jgi:hypothetical protein